MSRPSTLAELGSAAARPRTVREELRANTLTRLRSGAALLDGLVGFDDSVLPDLERALLAGHDIILLGERGQAKTRIVRGLMTLLDEGVPAVAGCEIHCHPAQPRCAHCRELAADRGDELPVVWLDRHDRFAEKLATPDTAVADLIGDVDPIKVAEGRHLADERTIHFGLVPRTNRGVIAINELPDLPSRIQVALLNVLEERDIQVRGYRLRLPLDVVLVATANPDDYTNRGRIISPLKDRFGTQVRTHYPRQREDEIAIVHQEASPPPVPVTVPRFMDEILVDLVQRLRESGQVNQRSGVSVRYTIGAHETMVAGAVRRAARTGESEAVPRVVDLWPVVPAALGRVEFDTLEEGREQEIVADALRHALLATWRRRLGGADFDALLARFDDGLAVSTGPLTGAGELLDQLDGDIPGLDRWLSRLDVDADDPGQVAAGVELVLEGLHLGRRLTKESLADTPDAARYAT